MHSVGQLVQRNRKTACERCNLRSIRLGVVSAECSCLAFGCRCEMATKQQKKNLIGALLNSVPPLPWRIISDAQSFSLCALHAKKRSSSSRQTQSAACVCFCLIDRCNRLDKWLYLIESLCVCFWSLEILQSIEKMKQQSGSDAVSCLALNFPPQWSKAPLIDLATHFPYIKVLLVEGHSLFLH